MRDPLMAASGPRLCWSLLRISGPLLIPLPQGSVAVLGFTTYHRIPGRCLIFRTLSDTC